MTLGEIREATRKAIAFDSDMADAFAYAMQRGPFRVPIRFGVDWATPDVIDIPVKIIEPPKLLKP